jgi:TetR/AcrR family transcriptional repressor of nem operon
MARPRSFDPAEVLSVARDLFWSNGFQATSLDDITAKTGVAKPSLYAAFGDKLSLFRRVLDDYHAGLLRRSERIILEGPSAREAIGRWLTSFVPYCSGVKGARSCLSVTAMVDGTANNEGVAASIDDYNDRLEQMIRKRLRADRVQFDRDFDPDVAARSVMALYTGLMVLGRRRPKADSVRSVIAEMMKLLH